MKSLVISTILMTITYSTTIFARAERDCPSQTLNCRLEKQLSTGGRSIISSTQTTFSGINTDEPSIPPASCSMFTTLENNELSFNITMEDFDYVANIYLTKKNAPSTILPGDTAFTVTPEKPFYYRYNETTLICTLSK